MQQRVLISNRIYANRMGNDDEASENGWKFRGRGLIQITGKDNYGRVLRDLFSDHRIFIHSEILEQPRYAVESACWFWKTNNLNALADKNDINAVTQRINGGLNGFRGQ